MITGDNSGKLPHYDEPPVTEVAFSVLFLPLEGLLSPHIGLLWERFQPEYPYCTDSNPIVPELQAIEKVAIGPSVFDVIVTGTVAVHKLKVFVRTTE